MFVSKFESDFELMGCIGYGAFGIVFKAKRIRDGEKFAIKRVLMAGQKDLDESKILLKCYHKNIIRFYESWIETPPPGWQLKRDEFSIEKCVLPSLFSSYALFNENYSQSSGRNEINIIESTYIYSIVELCQDYNLKHWLQINQKSTTKDYNSEIFREISEGVQYLYNTFE